jgi:hypothetical protein
MSDIKNTRHEWYLKNRERLIEYQKKYCKEKMNNDYKFKMSVVNYQSRYYQIRKNKLKEKKPINCKPYKIINIDINDTIVEF